MDRIVLRAEPDAVHCQTDKSLVDLRWNTEIECSELSTSDVLAHENLNSPSKKIPMRYQGKLTSWKDDQGFGYITPDGGSEQIFVHIKSFVKRGRRPLGNETLTYELAVDRQGRRRAEKVAFAAEGSVHARNMALSAKKGVLAVAGTAFFLLFVLATILTGRVPAMVIVLYCGASIVAFIAYAIDKSAARNGHWRTKESSLHVLALIGGWPGALAAQRLLRHKSSKQSFLIVYWGTVALNCVAFAWMLTPQGLRLLNYLTATVK